MLVSRFINVHAFRIQSDQNLGAMEIGTFLSLILFGIFLSQVYTYFERSKEDGPRLKLLVSALLLLEVFHTFTACYAIYLDTVTDWEAPQVNSYPLTTTTLFETLITIVVQCYFAIRIYRLSGSLHITILCFMLALFRFATAIGLYGISLLDVPKHPNGVFAIKYHRLVSAALAVAGATDVLIAASMTYYLRKLSSPTNFESTTQVINRLVRWSVQTGLITSLASVATIICFESMSNLAWLGVYCLLAKLYSNSLLASLNARPTTRSILDHDALKVTNLQFSSTAGGQSSIPMHLSTPGPELPTTTVTRMTEKPTILVNSESVA